MLDFLAGERLALAARVPAEALAETYRHHNRGHRQAPHKAIQTIVHFHCFSPFGLSTEKRWAQNHRKEFPRTKIRN
jgi:hypothetical protein